MELKNMSLSEQDIRRIVRNEIRQMLGVEQPTDIQYLPTNQAYVKLGYQSPGQLRKEVDNGTLRLGKEVQDRRKPDKIYRNYYFNIPACIQRLNTAPEKRAK